jgi:hypothetical protein
MKSQGIAIHMSWSVKTYKEDTLDYLTSSRGCSSVVEHMFSMHMALDFSFSTERKNRVRERERRKII